MLSKNALSFLELLQCANLVSYYIYIKQSAPLYADLGNWVSGAVSSNKYSDFGALDNCMLGENSHRDVMKNYCHNNRCYSQNSV